MAKCYIYGCHNQAPKDCWSGRCALHCTDVHCERHPKDEEDLPEPDNTDYLGEDSDCISSYSDEECGAKNGNVIKHMHGEYNTIECKVCHITIKGPDPIMLQLEIIQILVNLKMTGVSHILTEYFIPLTNEGDSQMVLIGASNWATMRLANRSPIPDYWGLRAPGL